MKRQRGSILLYGLLALAVVTLAGGAVWTYNNALKENARLASDLATTQTALHEQLAENHLQRERQARTDQLLARRQGEREATAALERKIDATLSSVYRTSEQARAWRDQPVPADVLRSLRDDGADRKVGADRPGIPAGKPAGAAADR